MAVSGSHAYVAETYPGGLRVIDVSTPASPIEVGFVDTPEAANGVAVSGSYAYVAANYAGLRVIDVVDAREPDRGGLFRYPGDSEGCCRLRQLRLRRRFRRWPAGDRRFDARKARSRWVSSTPRGMPVSVAVSGSYAYVADGYSGLRVIDVSTPANPIEVGFVDTPGYAYSVAVSGSYAYVADYHHGLRVIDVSTPARPIEVGWVGTPGYAYGVAVSGRYAFVAANYVGLYVIDVESPSAPIAVGIL